ncbi:MAG: AraC family transcriptional regulator, partial [Muribaculaceae bacterium]|nr:AraC family transcriptional regulator [Muribaculaceae bacterium]
MKHIPDDILNKLKAVMRRIEVAAAFDGIGNEDFNTATSVAKLAAISGMSERSLRDYFKLYTHYSLVRYTSARRAEYAARIFRLFPDISASEVARTVGFICPNGIYRLMRSNGIDRIASLHADIPVHTDILPYRKERLTDCVMFYRQEETIYKECSEKKFEEENWDAIEKYVESKFPDAKLKGYVGFAIDRYIVNDPESGLFISGILYQGIPVINL